MTKMEMYKHVKAGQIKGQLKAQILKSMQQSTELLNCMNQPTEQAAKLWHV
jgi:hypothetical protein